MESRKIANFIQNHLSKFLIFDETKQNKTPKKIIMNLYLRWCKLKHRKLLVKDSLVKMQLTNELKNEYPEIEHNERMYIGLKFKSDLVKL